METKSKKRRYFWIIIFALLIGGGFLFFYGYCWGLWGRENLLLQYLFQCGCPTSSKETRYPEQVDIIIPACRYVNTRLLPSGRFLYVREKEFGHIATYLLDLQMNEKITINLPNSSFYFLTDNLVYVSQVDGYILDWKNEKQYPIRKFVYLHPDASNDGSVNLKLLAKALHEAKYVYLISDNDTVIALSPDFPVINDDIFIVDRFDIPGIYTDRLEQFLNENHIVYQFVPASFPSEATSPDGKFVARQDGIYLIQTNQLIIRAYPSRLRGWMHDSSGAIYSSSGPCLIQTNFLFFDDTTCIIEVPQPVIKLKMPEEYLLPENMP